MPVSHDESLNYDNVDADRGAGVWEKQSHGGPSDWSSL